LTASPVAIEAIRSNGMNVRVIVMASGFVKLVVDAGPDRTQVDLGFDPATRPPVVTPIGPVRDLADLAGDKLLALFARAAARDFLDVAALLSHFPRHDLIDLAAAKDRGFSADVLADAFGVLPTYDRTDEFPSLSDEAYEALMMTFATWQDELRH
jgi:hypothetical protein